MNMISNLDSIVDSPSFDSTAKGMSAIMANSKDMTAQVLRLQDQGLTTPEIGELLGVSKDEVDKLIQVAYNPSLKYLPSGDSKDSPETLLLKAAQGYQLEALDNLVKVMKYGENESAKVSAAKVILDIAQNKQQEDSDTSLSKFESTLVQYHKMAERYQKRASNVIELEKPRASLLEGDSPQA